MISKKTCPWCQGSGIRMIPTSYLFGLLKREVPASCEHCNGTGYVIEMPPCRFCEGQGLVGNEREICRACNGTGKAGEFAMIPREKLKLGVVFARRCDKCGAGSFEIVTDIETKKLTKSWEREEELRQVEIIEQVKVRCVACGHSYHIPVDPEMHQELSDEDISRLESLGLNLSFMYQRD